MVVAVQDMRDLGLGKGFGAADAESDAGISSQIPPKSATGGSCPRLGELGGRQY